MAAAKYVALASWQMACSALLVERIIPLGRRRRGAHQDLCGRGFIFHQLPDPAGTRLQKQKDLTRSLPGAVAGLLGAPARRGLQSIEERAACDHLLFLRPIPAHRGRVERYTYNLARRLAAAGPKRLWSPAPFRPPQRETVPEDPRCSACPCGSSTGGDFGPQARQSPQGCRRAPVWAQEIDLCIINTRFYILSLYAAYHRDRRGIPHLVVDHSTGHLPMGSALLTGPARRTNIWRPPF